MKTRLLMIMLLCCGTIVIKSQHTVIFNCGSGNKISASQLNTCSMVKVKDAPEAIIKMFELSCTTTNGLKSVVVQGAVLSEPAVELLRSLKSKNKIFIEGVSATDASGKKITVKDSKFLVE